MIISMGKGIYEIDDEALENGKFVLVRVVCEDIEEE